MTVGELLHGLARAVPHADGRDPTTGGASWETPCRGIAYDSRRVQPGWMFVALKGQKTDAADFVPRAIEAGASAIVSERPPASSVTVPWLVVRDARQALAWLAVEYFGHPSREMRVVGVTGTNGKTTTAYLVSAIFSAAGVPCGLLGTVVYRVGDRELPATRTTPEAPELQALLRDMVAGGSTACAMEVSSHALALRRVDGTRFAAGIFTNLTRDHLDFHADMEDYFAAKRRLFELLPADAPAAINIDDPRGSAVMEAASCPVTYAVRRPADVTPGPLSLSLDGVTFDAHTPQGRVSVRSRLVGRPNVYNILAAVAATAALGVPLDAIERGLSTLEGVPGRFERVSTSHDEVTVIVDYAHTDDALRNLLETAKPLAVHRLITVFGAGGDRDRPKRPLMGMVAARLSNVVVITSDNPRTEDPNRIIEEVNRGAQPETRQGGAEVVTIVDRREAILHAIDRAAPGDVVLIAGKGHEKYQEIGGMSQPFDDAAVAREGLEARRLRSRVG